MIYTIIFWYNVYFFNSSKTSYFSQDLASKTNRLWNLETGKVLGASEVKWTGKAFLTWHPQKKWQPILKMKSMQQRETNSLQFQPISIAQGDAKLRQALSKTPGKLGQSHFLNLSPLLLSIVFFWPWQASLTLFKLEDWYTHLQDKAHGERYSASFCGAQRWWHEIRQVSTCHLHSDFNCPS